MPQIVKTRLTVRNGHICTAMRSSIVLTLSIVTRSIDRLRRVDDRPDQWSGIWTAGDERQSALVLLAGHWEVDGRPLAIQAARGCVAVMPTTVRMDAATIRCGGLAKAAAVGPLLSGERLVDDHCRGVRAGIEFPPRDHAKSPSS